MRDMLYLHKKEVLVLNQFIAKDIAKYRTSYIDILQR